MGMMELTLRNILPHFSSSRMHSLSNVCNKCFCDKMTDWNNKSKLLMEI